VTDDDIHKVFGPLWDDARGEDAFPKHRPLLAHYTKWEVLESILRNNEIWFSHPVLMNDPEEVIFGLSAGAELFVKDEHLAAACGPRRFAMLNGGFKYWFDRFANEDFPKTCQCGALMAITERESQSSSIQRGSLHVTHRF
jgi:hypothetical protein